MYAGKSLPPYIQIVQNYIKVTFHKFEDDCVDRRSPSMQCELVPQTKHIGNRGYLGII